jgi:hypothetical protein
MTSDFGKVVKASANSAVFAPMFVGEIKDKTGLIVIPIKLWEFDGSRVYGDFAFSYCAKDSAAGLMNQLFVYAHEHAITIPWADHPKAGRDTQGPHFGGPSNQNHHEYQQGAEKRDRSKSPARPRTVPNEVKAKSVRGVTVPLTKEAQNAVLESFDVVTWQKLVAVFDHLVMSQGFNPSQKSVSWVSGARMDALMRTFSDTVAIYHKNREARVRAIEGWVLSLFEGVNKEKLQAAAKSGMTALGSLAGRSKSYKNDAIDALSDKDPLVMKLAEFVSLVLHKDGANNQRKEAAVALGKVILLDAANIVNHTFHGYKARALLTESLDWDIVQTCYLMNIFINANFKGVDLVKLSFFDSAVERWAHFQRAHLAMRVK